MSNPDPIKLSENAIAKVYNLMQEEGNPHLKLRIYITGGGCSGFQYGFSFEDAVNTDDTIIKKKVLNAEDDDDDDGDGGSDSQLKPSVEVVIDALSLPYLTGAELDYCRDIKGEYFLIRNNPKAKTTCGCGSSFSA